MKERTCGLWVVNINTGEIIAFLRFEDAVQEIFAISILPGFQFPEVIDWDEKLLGSSYVLPDEALKELVLTERIPQPDDVEYFLNLGNNFYNQRNLIEAARQYQQCLTLNPDFLVARYNLGVVYVEQEEWEEAIAELQQVINTDPNHAQAYNNLGIVSQHQHRLSEASAYYQKAISIEYQFPDAHFNLGIALLQSGDLINGFTEWEWRWQTNNFKPFVCPQPLWDGSDIRGKTILIHTEQGAGDAIQFIRYIPLVAQQGCRIILVCIPNLMPLFTTVPGIDLIIPPGDILISDFDLYSPLMSLPHILGTTLETIPAEIPYLKVPENLSESPILATTSNAKNLKVGIVWAGSPTYKNDHHRSCKLEEFASIVNNTNVSFYSLQKEIKPTDADLLQAFNIQDLS